MSYEVFLRYKVVNSSKNKMAVPIYDIKIYIRYLHYISSRDNKKYLSWSFLSMAIK